jgi:excisionase family DNA binding protein
MEKLLSASQVAEELGMHPKTLYKLLRENKIGLNFIRVGKQLMFRPIEIEQHLSRHEVIRDGSGRKKKPARPMTGKKMPNQTIVFDGLVAKAMTDKEAQEFFKNCRRTTDGAVISNPRNDYED